MKLHYDSRTSLHRPESKPLRLQPSRSKHRPVSGRQFGSDLTNQGGMQIERPINIPSSSFVIPILRQSQPQSQVPPYNCQILVFTSQKEYQFTPRDSFMQNQKDLNKSMRALLLDWLIDIHNKFKLVPDTLYLAVNLIDRYLSRQKISKRKFQLLGITALLVASKCQDVYAPHIRDLTYLSDNTYSRDDVYNMQGSLLLVLNFQLTYTSPLMCLQKMSKQLGFSKKLQHFANYILELSLLQLQLCSFRPTIQARSTCLLTGKIFKHPVQNYYLQDQRRCMSVMFQTLLKEKDSNFTAVRRKFSQECWSNVSQLYIQLKE